MKRTRNIHPCWIGRYVEIGVGHTPCLMREEVGLTRAEQSRAEQEWKVTRVEEFRFLIFRFFDFLFPSQASQPNPCLDEDELS